MNADTLASKLTDEQIETFWSQMDRSGGPDADWEWNGDVTDDDKPVFVAVIDDTPYAFPVEKLALWLSQHGKAP